MNSQQYKSIADQFQKQLSVLPLSTLQQLVKQLYSYLPQGNIYEAILTKIYASINCENPSKIDNSEFANKFIQKWSYFDDDLKQILRRILNQDFLKGLRCSQKQQQVQQIKCWQFKNKGVETKGKKMKKKSTLAQSTNQLIKHIQNTNLQQTKVLDKKQLSLNEVRQGECFCFKKVISRPANTFKCIHCQYQFHHYCMRKNIQSFTNQCVPCFLKQIFPNKVAKQTLFAGVIRGDEKIVEFSIHKLEQLKPGSQIQMRCMRLSNQTISSILFPDYAKIQLNQFTTEYIPIHRNSSLKFRKDQPITIHLKSPIEVLNVKIDQNIPKNQSKDGRICVADHFIGFYVIQEKNIAQIYNQTLSDNITKLDQSLSILQSQDDQGSLKGEEITIQVQKISLICPLSSQAIKVPARGIFCTHFQCFDLHSYLIITSNSSLPKWNCPFCKKPAYKLVVDCILATIMKQNSQISQISKEVWIYRNGNYQFKNEKSCETKGQKNIYSLDIQVIKKRKNIQVGKGQNKVNKRSKKTCIVSLLD